MGTPHSTMSTLDTLIELSLPGYISLMKDKCGWSSYMDAHGKDQSRKRTKCPDELGIEDLFDSSTDLRSRDRYDGLTTFSPRRKPLHRSSTCLDLQGLTQEDQDEWRCSFQRPKKPKVEHDGRNDRRVDSLRPDPRGDDSHTEDSIDNANQDPTWEIGQWLGDGLGKNPVFEARFEAFFATHLELTVHRHKMKQVRDGLKASKYCYDACRHIRSGFLCDHRKLCAARVKLKKNIRKHELPSERQGIEDFEDGFRNIPSDLQTIDEDEARKAHHPPKAWLQGNEIYPLCSDSVYRGCREIQEARRNLIQVPIGENLSLPGVSIDEQVSLETAVDDLQFMQNFDPHPTVPREVHMQSMKRFAELVEAYERETWQYILDLDVMIKLLCPIFRKHQERERQLVLSVERRVEILESRWSAQLRSLKEVAMLLYGQDKRIVESEEFVSGDERVNCGEIEAGEILAGREEPGHETSKRGGDGISQDRKDSIW